MDIKTPISTDVLKKLRAGDDVRISGVIYTARDAAHKRMCEAISRGEELPFNVKGQVIYYVGPCPAKEGAVIGSCGPTTSGRMDKYAPGLINLGLAGMIGKGARNSAVIDAMKEHCCVYFGAIGGAGALLSRCVKSSEVIAYSDLGTEAVRRLTVENFPATVIIDAFGNNLFEIGRKEFAEK